jgi:hypothetical protein
MTWLYFITAVIGMVNFPSNSSDDLFTYVLYNHAINPQFLCILYATIVLINITDLNV